MIKHFVIKAMDGRVGVSDRRMTSAETEFRSYNFIATRNKNNELAAVGIGNRLDFNNIPGRSHPYLIRTAVGIGKGLILIIFQGDNYKPK
jgi:hypothetical protein